MAQDQRQEVFQRLGLPQEMLSRMPPPDPAAIGDVDVEWEEWKALAPNDWFWFYCLDLLDP